MPAAPTAGEVSMVLDLARPAESIAPRAVGGSEHGVVAAGVYADGRRVRDITIDEAGAWSTRPGHFVWIGLYQPSRELLRRVEAQFGVHELAVEDAERPHRRPKVEQYGDALFVVTRTAQLVDGRVAIGETQLFVGRGYVVSVRYGASSSYAVVRQRCEACPPALAHGEDYILYAILDFIAYNYVAVITAIHAEIDGIEDKVFASELSDAGVERLYMLRRDLLKMRNSAVPLIEVCRRVEHSGVRPLEPSVGPLIRDVTDRVYHIQEEIDSLREVLAFAFEASVMSAQMQQAHITRRLAAWAAILAVPTAVAGIYGMNFIDMPELHWRFGYFAVLGVVAVVCGVLYWRFRRHGWL
jgi:magnesium transporter